LSRCEKLIAASTGTTVGLAAVGLTLRTVATSGSNPP
jgi:hypothetical protein